MTALSSPSAHAVAPLRVGLPPRALTTVYHLTTRSFTMFQALYADLARGHRPSRRSRHQEEYQRRLERQAQHERLLALPRMLVR